MTTTSETQSQTEQVKSAAPSKPGSRKSIIALSVFALALNGTAALVTMPSFDIPVPNISGYVAELLPHEKASAPIPDPVVAALKDIQWAQQQQIALLQENSSLLHENAALRRKDSTVLVELRQSLTDDQVDLDVKKMSAQLSRLMSKVDTLQNSIAPEITSSIPKGHGRNRLTHKRISRLSKPFGPVSVGGAPLIAPAQARSTLQSPEG